MNLLKELEDFTINYMKGFLTNGVIDLNNGKFVYSNIIEDNYWNYIIGMDALSKKEFEKDWKINRQYMINKNKRPAIYITPSSNIFNKYKEILPDYIKIISHEAWMVLEKFNNINDNYNIKTRIEKNPSLSIFADAFMKSYSEISDEDPYGTMPAYYKDVIINSNNNITEYKRFFYVIYNNEIPIGTALTVEKDSTAIIGFVGTIPEYRKKGVCKRLMKEVINDLIKKNIKTIFLQTEEGYVPEKLYSNIGFKKVCTVILAVEE